MYIYIYVYYIDIILFFILFSIDTEIIIRAFKTDGRATLDRVHSLEKPSKILVPGARALDSSAPRRNPSKFSLLEADSQEFFTLLEKL